MKQNYVKIQGRVGVEVLVGFFSMLVVRASLLACSQVNKVCVKKVLVFLVFISVFNIFFHIHPQRHYLLYKKTAVEVWKKNCFKGRTLIFIDAFMY